MDIEYRAKEVVGWLSQNLWALVTGVGVLMYTYFMTKTRRRYLLEHPQYCKDSCSSQYQSNLFFLIGDPISVRFGSYHLNILFVLFIELSVRFVLCIGVSDRFMLFIKLDVRFNILFVFLLGLMLGLVITFSLAFGSVFTISTSLDLTSRLIFKLVPILKPGDDISILLL